MLSKSVLGTKPKGARYSSFLALITLSGKLTTLYTPYLRFLAVGVFTCTLSKIPCCIKYTRRTEIRLRSFDLSAPKQSSKSQWLKVLSVLNSFSIFA